MDSKNPDPHNVFDDGMNINPCAGGGFTVMAYPKRHDPGIATNTFAFSNITDLMSFLIGQARALGMPANKGHSWPLANYDQLRGEYNPTTAKADVEGETFIINAN